jgi:hypothetical protein
MHRSLDPMSLPLVLERDAIFRLVRNGARLPGALMPAFRVELFRWMVCPGEARVLTKLRSLFLAD